MNVPYKRILVPLDGSELSRQALPHAEALARQAEAQLILLRVVPYLSMDLATVDGLPLDWNDLDKRQRTMVDEAMQGLQALAGKLKFHHVMAGAIVEVGEAAEKIIDYARTHAIDLIVMSTHGRTGVQRWLMGSVASKVAAAASCPVLLVRPN
jgi:nucleotide-binding universal stress UspA family protein